jgi:hypothetical protein
MLHGMPLRPHLGATFCGARVAASLSTRTGYGVLLGMHCMSLRPRWGAAVCVVRVAASLNARTGYGVLLGMLHRMSLRSRLGAAFGGARGAAP